MERWIAGIALALVGLAGCPGDDAANGGLQSACVLDILGLERTLPDGAACDNFGYSDCAGFGSECLHFCAFDVCQPAECATAEDCAAVGAPPYGLGWACEEYVVSGEGYGTYCHAVEVCPEGTVGCPCAVGDTCGPDPWGDGDLSCVSGYCESACPASCIAGSVCCGGAFCSGDCIGAPCC